jgi:hypothetical protein
MCDCLDQQATALPNRKYRPGKAQLSIAGQFPFDKPLSRLANAALLSHILVQDEAMPLGAPVFATTILRE